jgi:hypothetical protein
VKAEDDFLRGADPVFEGQRRTFERTLINFLKEKVMLQLFDMPPDVTGNSTGAATRFYFPWFWSSLEFLSIKQLATKFTVKISRRPVNIPTC